MRNKTVVAAMMVTLLSTILLGVKNYSKSISSILQNKFLVTNVVDGDTIDLKSGERVRLYGINSAEYPEGCLSTEAKNRLAELVLNKNISIKNKGKDNFGRNLGMVYDRGLLINKVLITEGLAVYEGKTNPDDPELLAMEKANSEAQQTKRGLWSTKCSQPNPKCVIKGNFREADNTKVYSMPNCYNYQKTIVDPSGRDKWFCTEAEAVKAGFIKSKDCPGMK